MLIAPCLVIFIMADMEEVHICISALGLSLKLPITGEGIKLEIQIFVHHISTIPTTDKATNNSE